jgi:uncharacterized repeat protein (TIGR02543 family)
LRDNIFYFIINILSKLILHMRKYSVFLPLVFLIFSFFLTINHAWCSGLSDDNIPGIGKENGPLPEFIEGFDTVESPALPQGWSKIEITSGNASVRTVTLGTPVSLPNQVRFATSSDGAATLMLISPLVKNFQSNWLRFYANMSSGVHSEKLVVGYMASATDIGTFFAVDTVTVTGDVHSRYSVLFPEHLSDQDNYHIAFRFLPGNNFRNLQIDDVSWTTAPPGPVVEFIPAFLDFWKQQFGTTSASKQITIVNDGAETFTVYPADVTISGPDADDFLLFGIQEPVELLMGQALNINIAFSPEVVGQKQAFLQVKGYQALLMGESADATISLMPHFESFDHITPPALPFGWKKISYNPSYTSALVETTTATGPLSLPNHARINSNDNQQADMLLISPLVIDLPSTRINFWAKCNLGSNIPDLIIGTMSDPEDAATFSPFYTIQGGASGITNHYKEFIVTFNTSVPDNAHIAFKHGGTPSGNRSLFIDDVLVEQTPGGPGTIQVTFLITDDSDQNAPIAAAQVAVVGQPVILSNNEGVAQTHLLPGSYQAVITKQGYEAANISFEVESQAVNIDVILEEIPIVYYSLTLLTYPVQGGNVTGEGQYLHNQQVTISAMAATGYHFTKWTTTDGEIYSLQPELSFQMPGNDLQLTANFQELGIINEFPWFESFEEDSESRELWSQSQVIGNQLWSFVTGSSGGSITQANSGSINARFTSSNQGGTTMLISPILDISNLEDPRVVFWYGQQVWSGDQNEIRVVYRASQQDSWSELFHCNQNVPEWTRMAIALPNASSTYQIAFEGSDNWGRANVIDDVIVEETPEFHEITFIVLENSTGEDPVEGAVIAVKGNPGVATNSEGKAVILLEDLSYRVNIIKNGYLPESIEFVVDGEPINVLIRLNDRIIDPFNLQVLTQGLPAGLGLLQWNDAGGTYEFRYDNGMVHGQTGFEGHLNSVMGAVHRYQAEIHDISWVLTNIGGPHNSVKVWILGLTSHGLPDRDNVLYIAENVPSTDNQWSSYRLTEPLSAPDGFFLGLSYNGFIGLAVDNGMIDPWNFQPNTHFGVQDITDPSYHFTDISEWNVERNFLLRAYGKNMGPSKKLYSADKLKYEPAPGMVYESFPQGFIPKAAPYMQETNKALTGFNVFLNDMTTPFAENVLSTEFMFYDLQEGLHKAGVQSVYSSGMSQLVEVEFEIGASETAFSIVFTVLDEDGAKIPGATITLDDVTYSPGEYSFEPLAPGSYSYRVEHPGFKANEGDILLVDQDLVIEVVMLKDNSSVNPVCGEYIKIYPNPATSILYITSIKTIRKIRVFDISGKIIIDLQLAESHSQLDISGLNNGIYIVQLIHDAGYSTRRFQIAK